MISLKTLGIKTSILIDQRRKKNKNLQAKQNILEFQVAKTKKKLKKQLDEMKIINGIN